jgi:hypothetical protein
VALLRDEKGKTVFRAESGPLAEIMSRIEERANYGETASGRLLADEFAKEPFGWDFEAVRLLVLSLLRAGKVEATSKGQTIESTTGVEARETFSNNNIFRQASFRPKKGIEFAELMKASEAFRDTFGKRLARANRVGIQVEGAREAIFGNADIECPDDHPVRRCSVDMRTYCAARMVMAASAGQGVGASSAGRLGVLAPARRFLIDEPRRDERPFRLCPSGQITTVLTWCLSKKVCPCPRLLAQRGGTSFRHQRAAVARLCSKPRIRR